MIGEISIRCLRSAGQGAVGVLCLVVLVAGSAPAFASDGVDEYGATFAQCVDNQTVKYLDKAGTTAQEAKQKAHLGCRAKWKQAAPAAAAIEVRNYSCRTGQLAEIKKSFDDYLALLVATMDVQSRVCNPSSGPDDTVYAMCEPATGSDRVGMAILDGVVQFKSVGSEVEVPAFGTTKVVVACLPHERAKRTSGATVIKLIANSNTDKWVRK